MVTLALLLGAICLATTVLALRSPGMNLMRIPMFSWSALVASVMWIVSLPVLLGTLVLAWVDHSHAGIAFGSNAELAGHVTWAFVFPQVYLLAVMLLGFFVDVLATTSGTRARRSAAWPWAPSAPSASSASAPTCRAVAPPTSPPSRSSRCSPSPPSCRSSCCSACVGDLFRRGRFSVNAGVGFAVAGILTLLLATLGGAITSISAVDAGVAARDGVTHAALFAASSGRSAGCTGGPPRSSAVPRAAPGAYLAPLLLLVGTAAYVIPDLVSGWAGDGAGEDGGHRGAERHLAHRPRPSPCSAPSWPC